jgi:hypothetical protein
MMHTSETKAGEKKRLLFELEVLKARLEIRDFFLNSTVRDIYENVGQVLSVVRMQLAILNPALQVPVEELVRSGDLVGSSIRDLRGMTRRFYPDEDIMKDNGLAEALKYTLLILNSSCKIKINRSFFENDTAPGIKVVTFKILMELLISISEAKETIDSITISGKDNQLVFTISHTNRPSPKGEKHNQHLRAAVADSLQVILGQYSCKTTLTGNTKILFKVPCKMNLYE